VLKNTDIPLTERKFVTFIPAAAVVIIYYLSIGSILRRASIAWPLTIVHPERGPLSGKRCKGSVMEDEIG